MTKTIEQVTIAQSYEAEGKHALAVLHLNAAAVFAAGEMPQRVPDIREALAFYRAKQLGT